MRIVMLNLGCEAGPIAAGLNLMPEVRASMPCLDGDAEIVAFG
jgi:hypothetical protein